MIRAWIAIILLALGIAAVRAMPASQQIIMFGKGSSASGGGGGGCGTGVIDASAGCPLPMLGS